MPHSIVTHVMHAKHHAHDHPHHIDNMAERHKRELIEAGHVVTHHDVHDHHEEAAAHGVHHK